MQKDSNMSKRRRTAVRDGSVEYVAKRVELVAIAARKFKENGFSATSFAEISEQANLDRATMYYYFGSKEDLFRECLRHGVNENIDECLRIFNDGSLSDRKKLEAIIRQLMKAYDENYPNMYVYIQEEMKRIADEKTPWAEEIFAQTRQFEQIVLTLISSLRANRELRDDIPVSLAANAIFGMLNWTHRWYDPKGSHRASEVSDAFVKVFFDGMSSNCPKS
tara:strand:- start:816 stop:1478 length:663 start_codon:yes stop_codon:yes gene_type:complete